MKMRHLLPAFVAVVGLHAATPAHALPSYALMAPSFALAGIQRLDPCEQARTGTEYFVRADAGKASASKASAILGGQVSQLEMIARQQSAASNGAALALVQAPKPAVIGGIITPGAIGRCQGYVVPRALPQTSGLGKPLNGNDDFLESKRLVVQRTSFDVSWNRVRGSDVSGKLATMFGRGAKSGRGLDTLGMVNTWVNDHIRYVEDAVLYGQADYWATAGATLKRRAGDCEDIAIAKMQLLARMGVRRSDMYLTIARDTVRHADHALLVVKMDGRHWLLDNSTSQVLDAEQSHGYRPILSFGSSNKWVHGY